MSRTIRWVTRTRQEALDRIGQLSAAAESGDGERTGDAMAELLRYLAGALAAPDTIRVDDTHMQEAMAVATAYTDSGNRHALLADVLARLDERASVDASFRLGVYAALAQLVCDALIAAVMTQVADDEDLDQIDAGLVTQACLQLLQRIALTRHPD